MLLSVEPSASTRRQDSDPVNVPYDLTWEAVHTVVAENQFKVLGDDPNDGIVEAEAHSFTLADADCGQMKSVGVATKRNPTPAAARFTISRLNPPAPKLPT